MGIQTVMFDLAFVGRGRRAQESRTSKAVSLGDGRTERFGAREVWLERESELSRASADRRDDFP